MEAVSAVVTTETTNVLVVVVDTYTCAAAAAIVGERIPVMSSWMSRVNYSRFVEVTTAGAINELALVELRPVESGLYGWIIRSAQAMALRFLLHGS